MAKVYGGIEGLEVPQFNWKDLDAHKVASEKYIEDMRATLKEQNPNGANVGEVIKFPVADGQALYMVASMKPVSLVHIALDDAYQYPDVALYKAKDVQTKIDQQKALDAFFAKKG